MRWFSICLLVFVSLTLTGCPDPTREFLFQNEHVAKISFMKDGECTFPIYIACLTTYSDSAANAEICLYLLDDGARNASNTDQDFYFVDEATCSVYISHNPFERYPGEITNLVPEYVPIEIHAQEICAFNEFHFSGNIPTTDVSVIPACQDVLDGWVEGEESIVDSCLQQIPITFTAETTDATGDYDWPNYSQTIGYTCP